MAGQAKGDLLMQVAA